MAVKPLERYRSMRDFSRTQEPSGRRRRAGTGFFVVQKHDARRLHYDFRLAHGGVLLSWAVTRGPSLDPADKRLAVRTEDHPLDYADFEGTIPKGEYGGGTVMLWDRGGYRPVGDLDAGLQAGKIEVELEGERLRGGFALVRMRGRRGEKRENWLLIKRRDADADPDWAPETFDTSIASGRAMAEIAQRAPAAGGRAPPRRKDKAGGKARTGLPAFVSPQLATLVEEAPEGKDWLHEVKYDGYRLIAAVAGAEVRLYTRSGRDWTARFGGIAGALAARYLPPALLDGEVVANVDGRTDFGALQRALRDGAGTLAYHVFDLLQLKDRDLRDRPLLARKKALHALLGRRRDPVRYSDHEQGRGERVARQACRLGLEGIVSKRAAAPYRSGRNRDWRKVKCVRRQEFVIGGWSPSGRGRPFASLLLGNWADEGLRYAGRVGTGFDAGTLEELGSALRARERKTPPFAAVPGPVARKARWCRPDLVAEIAYAEMTGDGQVRHGVFLGLREDKPARSITMEKTEGPGGTAEDRPAGVALTNPDRVLFPTMGTTKRDLAAYLVAVAPRLLPHLRGRPVSLVRCPQGRGKACFFQKHAGKGFPDALGTVPIREKGGAQADYLLVESAAALAACAQIGVLELHVWGSRRDAIEKPDRIVLDLDPDPEIPFAEVRRAARELADVLAEGGLTAFPLATGGKGVHLVVPVVRRHPWPVVSAFAKAFAGKMADLDPERFVATMSKARRKGRIFIDHFRNQRGATAIAPFSPRAREGAPVAMPVSWAELASLPAANRFSFADALRRAKQADPWREQAGLRQSLSAAKLRRIGLKDLL